ncbi:ComEC/Rec2 family competence protein [Weissella kandleri]|uniref:ComEC/Rec2 family competence protein n=1 Tax=Weissella kandleri TaxID=1616 RepID=UPI00387ED6AC
MKTGYWFTCGVGYVCLYNYVWWQIWWLIFPILWSGWILYQQYRPQMGLSFVGGALLLSSGCLHQQVFPIAIKEEQPLTVEIYLDNLRQTSHGWRGSGWVGRQEVIVYLSQEQVAVANWRNRGINGLRINGVGEIRQPREARNRFSFDERKNLWQQGIVHQVWLRKITNIQQVQRLDTRPWYENSLRFWHMKLVDWFEHLPPALRDYGETLFLGYVRPYFYHENVGLQKLGLVHLFSISGFQVMLFYQAWRYVGRYLWIPRGLNLFGLQFGLLGVWSFAGNVLSLIRPIGLASLMLWREAGLIRLNGYDAWGITAILGVTFQPGIFQTLGGQLSYLLALGLLTVQQRPWWQQSLWLGLLIMPLLANYTGWWHPLALIVNIIAVPIFTWVIIPVIIMGVMAALFHSTKVLAGMNQIVESFRTVLKILDQAPLNLNFMTLPNILIGILIYLLLILLVTQHKILGWVLGILIVIWWGFSAYPVYGKVVFFDVGQGDATLIRPPFGQAVTLVDVGGKMQWGRPKKQLQINYQAQELASNLSALGVAKIDYLVLTHQDFDHIGNLPALSRLIKIEQIIIPAGMEQTPAFNKMIAPLQIPVQLAIVPQAMANGATLLHPYQPGRGRNEDSLALLIPCGPENLILTGDLDRTGEHAILQRFKLPEHSLLKLGHHGSKTSTAQEWLQILRPKVGIISAGVNNRYQHPSLETLMNLQQAQIPVWNTQVHGMIEYTWFLNWTWWRSFLNDS